MGYLRVLSQGIEPPRFVAGVFLTERPRKNVCESEQWFVRRSRVHRDNVSSDALCTPEISDRALVGLVFVGEPAGIDDEGTGVESRVERLDSVRKAARSSFLCVGV